MRQLFKANARIITTTAILILAGASIAVTAYLSGRTMTEMELRSGNAEALASEHGQVNRELQDLTAQQTMAVWTMVVALTGMISLGITAAGVIAVWRTLEETRKAVEATSAGTQAMRETSSQTERIGKAQVRAYLTPIKVEIDRTEVGTRLEVTLKNSGQSPAFQARIGVRTTIVYKSPEPPGGIDVAKLLDSSSDSEVIAAGATCVTTLDLRVEPGPAAWISAFARAPESVQRNIDHPIPGWMNFEKDVDGVVIQCNCIWLDVFGHKQQLSFGAQGAGYPPLGEKQEMMVVSVSLQH